jgi:drug/metabolite transporter (DMT)-like permease
MVRDTKGAPRGVALAFVCLLLLGLMPIITNGRPAGFGALTFALVLSAWQLLFSLPLLIVEWRSGERGIFRQTLPLAGRRRVLAITLFTGLLFALSTWAYVAAFEKVGAVNAAIALQAYPLFAAGLEALLLGRRKSRTELGFTALILIALYGLATQGTWRMSGLTPWFSLALAIPVLWSIAHIILREQLVTTSITPNQVTTSRLVVTVLVLLPLTLGIEGSDEIARSAVAWRFQTFGLLMGLAYYVELIVCQLDHGSGAGGDDAVRLAPSRRGDPRFPTPQPRARRDRPVRLAGRRLPCAHPNGRVPTGRHGVKSTCRSETFREFRGFRVSGTLYLSQAATHRAVSS